MQVTINLMVLVVHQQVIAALLHAVVTSSQLAYAVQLPLHLLQQQMENIFNNCLRQIGHPFKLTTIATT